ncbi:hypothetical protein Bca4012_061153 [Brassica carinata]
MESNKDSQKKEMKKKLTPIRSFKEKRSRLYIIRRCLVMLLCWREPQKESRIVVRRDVVVISIELTPSWRARSLRLGEACSIGF